MIASQRRLFIDLVRHGKQLGNTKERNLRLQEDCSIKEKHLVNHAQSPGAKLQAEIPKALEVSFLSSCKEYVISKRSKVTMEIRTYEKRNRESLLSREV